MLRFFQSIEFYSNLTKFTVVAVGIAAVYLSMEANPSSSEENTEITTEDVIPTDCDKFYLQFGVFDSRFAKNSKKSSKKKKTTNELVPIIYSSNYNIQFMGLEKLHPFDSCKYRNIYNFLVGKEFGILLPEQFIEPKTMPSEEILKEVHSEEYLKSLTSSKNVAYITEIFLVAALPNFLVRNRVLNPMLYGVSGSILAGKVAVDKGWAINLSGGYHHACHNQGGGFCAYSDITLSYRLLRKHSDTKKILKVLIVDLDAHQGNGHERDKLKFNDTEVYIFDMFNGSIYPGDFEAKAAINKKVELRSGVSDGEYLERLEKGLTQVFEEFTPDVIYYNAGTDILEGDALGRMNISALGVVKRDEMVFRFAMKRENPIPIVMLLSGGYQMSNARVIASSIINLNEKFNLTSKADHSNL